MKNKVIVNGIDVLKDIIKYKDDLIKDLKDIVSKQQKLLELYKEYVKGIKSNTDSTFHHENGVGDVYEKIKELENEISI